MNNILLAIDVQNGFQRNHEKKDNAVKIADLLRAGLFDKIIANRRNRLIIVR